MTNIVIATSFLIITNWVTTSVEVTKVDGINKTNYYQSGVVASNTISADYRGTNVVFTLKKESEVLELKERVVTQ